MRRTTRVPKDLQVLFRERLDAHTLGLRGVRTDGANWTVRHVWPLETYRAEIARSIREMQVKYHMYTEAGKVLAGW